MGEAAERTSDPHGAAVFAELADKWTKLAELACRYGDCDELPSSGDYRETVPEYRSAQERRV